MGILKDLYIRFKESMKFTGLLLVAAPIYLCYGIIAVLPIFIGIVVVVSIIEFIKHLIF